MTMVVIGYDRYNVIVKGLAGKRITPGMAAGLLLAIWIYSVLVCIGPFLGWGDYKAEGLIITCSYDFLSTGVNQRTFILFAYIFNYFTPMLLIIIYYTSIVKAVVAHEAALKAQAKKMNVDSLRSGGKDDEDSAEVKIAKVAITNVLLWFCIWTPYAAVCSLPVLGSQASLTPLVCQIPSFLGNNNLLLVISSSYSISAKTASCINPIVYAVSHPKFRESLRAEIPCCCFGDKPEPKESNTTSVQST